MADIPVVETERLVLRGRRLEDFPAFAAIWGDKRVTQYFGAPLSREAAWVKFSRENGDWTLLGFGFWLVEEKATGKVIGDAGVSDFKRDIEPSLDGKPEFGWVLAADAQGKGYATEAARAALSWADARMPGAVMSCLINAENAPSIRVAEKCGFREFARTNYHASPVILFERPAS